MKDLIANQLVKYLEARGVEHIFGLCGHTNIAVLAALSKSKKIKFVNTRHEQIAAHAADGYARATKKTSVVLSHLSPGLTNAATGVANAALDSIPMVVIAGDVPTHYYGKHPHQEVNLHADASQYEIYRPFVKRAWRVDSPHLFPEIIEKAFTLAESGRPGPGAGRRADGHLLQGDRRRAVRSACWPTPRRCTSPRSTTRRPRRSSAQLLAAKTPLLYVGGGILLADAADRDARARRAPVAAGRAHADGQGRAARRPSADPRHDRLLGHEVHQRQVQGRRLDPRPRHALLRGRLQLVGGGVHVQLPADEADPHRHRSGRDRPQLSGGDRRGGRSQGSAEGAEPRRAQARAEGRPAARSSLAEMAANRKQFVAGNRKAMESDAWPMRPERILADLRAALPRDAILCTDVGWNKNGMAQQYPIYTPGSVFTPGGYATMGFGSPAALGAKVALPDKVVVALIGDGGFGQNPAVLATAFEEDIAVVWVIMNNHAFGTIAGLEKAHYGTTFGTVFEKDGKPWSPDYAAIARAYGVDGVKVDSAAEFKPALEKAIKSKRPCRASTST